MKKTAKAMLFLLCAVLVVACSAIGTLAYLQMNTAPITNTFVSGKVEITLKEYGIKPDGTVDTGVILDANGTLSGIKLVPGREIQKRPFITVDGNSEACYLFVKVETENDFSDKGTITWSTGWTELEAGSGIWYYSETDNAGKTVNVFENFTCSSTVTDYKGFTGTIKITAYAVQAAGFDTAGKAWDATFGK